MKPARPTPDAESAPDAKGTRRGLVETQIMAAATRLFAERGFAGTSLQDVADATGLTRPALYHYFSSKEDLLSRLVNEVTESPAEVLQTIRLESDQPAAVRLREMAFAIALMQATEPARFRLMIRSEADFPTALLATYEEGRRNVLREFSSVIAEGVETGELRQVVPRTAALGIIGLCNWVAWWHHPSGGAADREVAGALADMALASVAANRSRPETTATTAAGALELVKQNLALLEKHLPPA